MTLRRERVAVADLLMNISRTSSVLLAALLAAGCEGASPSPSSAQQRTLPPPAATATGIAASRRTAITTAVERVAGSVVTVQTETVQQVQPDIFSFMFGEGGGGSRRSAGIGSGFIIRKDGVVVTNAHVVAGASAVSIAMRDGTTYPAKIVGIDETNDLAVVKFDGKDLPVAPLGVSGDLLVGEWVIAIGNPFGFVLGNSEPSVSVGVVSAVGRNLSGRGEGGGVYLDMIQTDAAINPGNSGGPLINAVGEVIGVNSSIYSPSGGSVGLGFAIPIDRTKRIAEDLLEHGTVKQPWIGVILQASEVQSAREAATVGAVVARVVPGSPAEKAGLREGDNIVRVGARPVRNSFDWQARLLDLRVGETLPVTVKRLLRETTVNVTVANQPDVGATRVTISKELEVITLTESIRGERGISAGAGALVTNVTENVARQIGLQPGDVIVQVNNTRVQSAQQASQLISTYARDGSVYLTFERSRRLLRTPPFSLN